jgi:ParB family chromosome partitioning protein
VGQSDARAPTSPERPSAKPRLASPKRLAAALRKTTAEARALRDALAEAEARRAREVLALRTDNQRARGALEERCARLRERLRTEREAHARETARLAESTVTREELATLRDRMFLWCEREKAREREAAVRRLREARARAEAEAGRLRARVAALEEAAGGRVSPRAAETVPDAASAPALARERDALRARVAALEDEAKATSKRVRAEAAQRVARHHETVERERKRGREALAAAARAVRRSQEEAAALERRLRSALRSAEAVPRGGAGGGGEGGGGEGVALRADDAVAKYEYGDAAAQEARSRGAETKGQRT